MKTALNYLGNSQNEKVVNLKERLCISLGQKPSYSQVQQSRKNSMRQSFSNYLNQPQGQQQQPQQFNQGYGQFNTGLPNVNTNQPWQQHPVPAFNQPPPAFSQPPPKPFSPAPTVPPLTQPSRPISTGSANGMPHFYLYYAFCESNYS